MAKRRIAIAAVVQSSGIVIAGLARAVSRAHLQVAPPSGAPPAGGPPTRTPGPPRMARFVAAVRRVLALPPTFFWFYLLAVTVAELVTSVVNVEAGLVCHALLMVTLLVHGALGRTENERHLALALTLAPLIRLLSITIPLADFPQAAWYPIVTAPLLLAMWLATRQFGLARQQMGVRLGNWRLQLLLVGWGLGLGAVEYRILQPKIAIASFSWWDFVLFALSLAIFTGFSEEIMFRGVLQAMAGPVLRRWTLPFVALLFGALHIGYLSIMDVIFVTAVGLLFGYVVSWSGSILGVTLAHGLTNITLFLIMPALATGRAPFTGAAPWIVAASTMVGTFAAFRLWRAAVLAEHPAPVALLPVARTVSPVPDDAAAAPPLPARPTAGETGQAGRPRIAPSAGVWEAWRTGTLAALIAGEAPHRGG